MNSEPVTIRPAPVAFRDGALYSEKFADIYHSVDGAIAQASHVFLGGNGLPQRWHHAADFTIVETGFGCGLNFLATWDALKRSGAACRLDFVSAEKHPFNHDDLAAILRAWPQFEAFSGDLLRAYPPLIPGFHRLHFDAGRVTLTLLFGDALDMLTELDARANAVFLDGFAPSKNAEMWSDALLRQIRRIAAPGATVATYSAAASVRTGLELAGFSVEKRAGFARKRDMLAACLPGPQQTRPGNRKALVVGAGIAGASCAFALARRGIEVELLDRQSSAGNESSFNPAAIVRPFLTLDAGSRSRFNWAAFPYAVRFYRSLSERTDFCWRETGVLQLARDAAHQDKLLRAIEALSFPSHLVSLVDPQQASVLCGAPVRERGIWFPSGGFVDGHLLCAALVNAAGQTIQFHKQVEARAIRTEGGLVHIADAAHRVIASGDLVILANGVGAQAMIPGGAPWLGTARGQVTGIPAVAPQLRAPVCRDGYVTPLIGQHHLVGATFDKSQADAVISDADHQANLLRATRILPEVFERANIFSISGWGSVRCVSRDRLPVVGPADANANLFYCIAMGSRGFSWAPLASESLASIVAGAPSPLERCVQTRLLPTRFFGHGPDH